jgi:hypothetical protein
MIAKTITEQMDQTREMTRFYLSQLKDADPYKIHVMNNNIFNPIIWEIGHLAVTQNWLVMYLCKGPAERISWGKTFSMGSIPTENKEDYPPYDEVWEMFKHIHEKAVHFVANLSTDELLKKVDKDLFFLKNNTYKDALMHSIRHEGIHAGHLSCQCKLN